MAVRPLHVTMVPAGAEYVILRYWRDNPNQFTDREVPLADLQALLARAEADYYAFEEPDLVAVGRRLYDWLDGTDRWLARELDSLRGFTVALLIDASPVLAPLPWEALHDGTAFLVRAANPTIIPIRWRPNGPPAREPANRALHVLFMATSPLGVKPELNFEEEEATILRATDRHRITLTVEETGSLAELETLAAGYGEGAIDMIHLTGHADHHDDGPKFLTEDETGKPKWVSAEEIARALPHVPRLAFLSGCRSAQTPKAGVTRSLAEQLLDRQFPAVLGWGRPVYDSDATLAAGSLYERLGQGASLVEAMAHAHRDLDEKKAKHWHLLRLFVAGDALGPVVTASKTANRKPALPPSHERRFLSKSLNVGNAVVGRAGFVGRRRPLQRVIRHLRTPPNREIGAVLFGTGGVGKSSIALRVCDRLTDFDPVVVVGVLDEQALLRAMESVTGLTEEQRAELQGLSAPLSLRFRRFLERRRVDGCPQPLLILDDFEQNYPRDGGSPRINPDAVTILDAIVAAFDQLEYGRCLITSWYRLNTTHQRSFYQESLLAMSAGEVERKRRSLGNLSKSTAEIRERVERVADGNPRLLERLDQLLETQAVDLDGLLKSMEAVAAKFREQVCFRQLLAGLPESARRLLAALLVYRLPVPLAAVTEVAGSRMEPEVQKDLDAAVAVGLCEREPVGPAYRVPQLLDPEFTAELRPEPVTNAELAAVALKVAWWDGSYQISEAETLELLRVACLGRRADVAVPVAARLGLSFRRTYRYQEARRLYEGTIASVGRDFRLLDGLAEVLELHGDGDAAFAAIQEAVTGCPTSDEAAAAVLHHYTCLLIARGRTDETVAVIRERLLPMLGILGDVRLKALTMGRIADVLQSQGQLKEALRIRREEELPVYERLGDLWLKALTMGRIADVLQSQGQLEEALRIRREEELPVYERLGDVREKALTIGKIADVLQSQGQLKEALRIHREEQLPVYERLGDVREKALTMGRIADVLQSQGQWEEALRIRREEELPVYERLGHVRSKALTMGKIADVLQSQGQLKEALRIRREEELPVFERLGDVREKAVTMGRIADVLQSQGQLEEALRIHREEQLPVYERLGDVRSKAVTMGRIADVLQSQGQLKEALRIRREEELPVFERLGDVREKAVTMGRIADVLQSQGQLEEALRIRREEQLPVYERLGDVRSKAVTMGRIADVLQAQGQWEEALRIRREEELPVYERLGDVWSKAVTIGKIADVLQSQGQSQGQLEEALRIRREEQLPVYERLGDVRSKAVTMGKIADVLQSQGQLKEALRIRREEELPVYERLGDVRLKALTMGRIADVLQSQGQWEEALRIRREEELPVFERLGDVRSKAVTMGKIADVLQSQGQLKEALRIRREEELPVYERLGDVRSKAVTMGKIADVLQAQGQWEEALRIRREEELPVFERLGDVRSLIVARVNLALNLAARRKPEDAAEVVELLTWAATEAENRGYAEADQIQQLLRQLLGGR